jgi:hypothetical protein
MKMAKRLFSIGKIIIFMKKISNRERIASSSESGKMRRDQVTEFCCRKIGRFQQFLDLKKQKKEK